MRVVDSTEYTKLEKAFLESLPKDIEVSILEHNTRRLYLLFDEYWIKGGHPAVYNTTEEMTADFLHDAMHDMEDAVEED